MTDASYGYTKSLGQVSFDEALGRVTEALKTEGFGVLTEIDVQATFAKKLDRPFRPYRILGACNPPLAFQALSAELPIGLLLPCNVVVFEEDDGSVTVSIARPKEMFKVTDNAELAPLAEQVDARLVRVLERI